MRLEFIETGEKLGNKDNTDAWILESFLDPVFPPDKFPFCIDRTEKITWLNHIIMRLS